MWGGGDSNPPDLNSRHSLYYYEKTYSNVHPMWTVFRPDFQKGLLFSRTEGLCGTLADLIESEKTE